MPDVKLDDITKVLKDAVYVSVGLGVIAFQRAQVQRRELRQRFTSQFGDVSKLVDERVKTVEERMSGVEERLDSVLDRLESRLPDQARAASQQARTAAKEARGQLRQFVARTSA